MFRIKGLWRWPLTSQGHPKWSSLALCVISVGSYIVTVVVLNIFHVKKYDLDFWPFKVIQGQIWWCQSKARGSYVLVLPGDPTSYLAPFSRYFESKFWGWHLTAQGHPRSNLMVLDLAEDYSRRLSAMLQNFSLIARAVYEMCVTKGFHFWPWG